jgi:outer membrane biosynthesis protein TonB
VTPEHEPAPRCLDAETMAAWVDRALPAAEAAAAEAHVADCARCQAVLAVLVQTLPAVATPVPWWRRGWALGTLVPIAVGALALAVWIATPRSPQAPQVPASSLEQTPTTPPAVASTPPPAAPTLAENAPRAEAPAKLDRDKQNPAAAPAPARAAASPAEAKKEPANAAVDQLRRADAAPAPSAAAAPPAAGPAAQAPTAEARQAAPARALGSALNKTAASVDIVSPDPLVRWRIGAAGSIQRSADGGATFVAQPSGVTQDLTAGMSPQRGVCWVVGRAGTVLVLTNPNLWRRLDFPEPVDLTQVDARDGLAATVTAADGRRFRTSDGGQTWARLQDF